MIKITKKQFVKLMTVVKERCCSLEGVYSKLNELFGDVGDAFINNTSLFSIVKTISEIVCDNDKNG